MTSNVIDYFATLGKSSGPFVWKSFKSLWSDTEQVSATTLWTDAITDIAVVTQDDSNPDESWSLVNTSADGAELVFPYLAVKRRSATGRSDHITELKLVQPGEPIPVGYELITRSVNNIESAQIKPLGFIAVKRAVSSEASFLVGEPMIDDICLVLRSHGDDSVSEDIPENYHEVVKSSFVPHIPPGSAVVHPVSYIITYHRRAAVGICDLKYESATLDRYPQQDYGGLSLPVNELPMFAFPNDLTLTYSSLKRFPLPVFFTFVFTDQNGGHFYAACLRFYETVSQSDIESIFHAVYGDSQQLDPRASSHVFCPKVVCAISKRPFYRAMRRFLRQIYSLSLSSLSCPLEYFIASLVNQVPLPVEGGRPFHVMLDSALISPTSKPMEPIIFDLPVARYFPHMDLDFSGPLRCLSVDHLLAIFTLMLREAKILFVCSSNTMLTDVMESLRMLLFPLTWASCFVSRLPDALGGMLEAPGGFMIGIHVQDTKSTESESGGKNTFQHYSTRSFAETVHTTHSIVAGSYIVDLSTNFIFQYDGRSVGVLTPTIVEQLLKSLPLGPKTRLKNKLQKVAAEYRIGPQTAGFEEFDSAFDFQSQDDTQITAKKWEEFPTLAIRDAFMVFMVDFLGDYPLYIIPPIEDMTVEDTYRTFKEEFSVNDYLDDAGDNTMRATLELLMETQMFAVLLQMRSEGSHYSVVFFEQAAHLLRHLGLSAGGHSSGHNAKALVTAFGSNAVPEMPAPLFELLEAHRRWAALSKSTQQQLLTSTSVHGHQKSSTSPSPHPHQLSMLHVGSATSSPMRSFSTTPTKPQAHTVHNEMLNDLLTMYKIMKSSDMFKRVSLDDVSGNNRRNLDIARTELDRSNDLQLQNRDAGPLVVPGPVLRMSSRIKKTSSRDQSDVTESDDLLSDTDEEKVLYSYHAGWPVFDKNRFEEAKHNIHPRLMEVRQARLFAIEKVNKRMLMFIRSPCERLAFEQEGKLRNKIKLDTPREEVSAIISAVLDLASVSVTLLAIRVLRLTKPVADVMQMLGVLAQVESCGLLHVLDECVWRTILIACGSAGGDLMRKVACVVFEGISANPDALTYGQYIQALNAKKVNVAAGVNGENKSDELDQFMYLEEMGHTWFMQRSALIERALVEQDYSHSVGASGSPTTMFSKTLSSTPKGGSSPAPPRRGSWSMMTGGDSTPRGLDHVNQIRLTVKASTIAAQMTAEQFGLVKTTGLLCFLRPSMMRGIGIPRPTRLMRALAAPDSEELEKDVRFRLEKFAEDALSISSAGAKLKRRMTLTRRRNDSVASNNSMLSSVSGVSFNSSPEKISQALVAGVVSGGTSSVNMMSRLYGAAKQSAVSSVSSVAAATSTTNNSKGGHSPMSEGWGKRFGASMFSRSSANTTPIKTPPPAPVTRSVNSMTTPPPSLQNTARTGVDDVTLNVLSQNLNFDDEDDEDDEGTDRDSLTSKNSAMSAAVSANGISESHELIAGGIASIDMDSDGQNGVDDVFEDVIEKEPAVCDTNDSMADVVPERAEIAPKQETEQGEVTEKPETDTVLMKTESSDDVLKLKPLNVDELQTRIGRAFETEFSAQGMVMGIHSMTSCVECGHCMLEEEVLALWCKYQTQDIHTHKGNKSKTAVNGGTKPPLAMPLANETRNMREAHKLSCPHCATEFNPLLHIRSYRLKENMSSDVSVTQATGGDVVLSAEYSSDTIHLSPFGLRFQLEELIQTVGECAADTHWLHTHRPELYWSIVWYSNRSSLPTGFSLPTRETTVSESVMKVYESPVVVGWRESVVKAKARRLLAPYNDRHTVELIDIFPQCTTTELDILSSGSMEKMSGSPAAMRNAMLTLCSQCPGVLADPFDGVTVDKTNSAAIARAIYVSLLTVCYYLKKSEPPVNDRHNSSASATLAANDLIRSLTKECTFDKLFVDAIKWVLSKNDLQAMHTTEADLLSFVATKDIQAVRVGFGFHF